jgi:ribosome-associated protein
MIVLRVKGSRSLHPLCDTGMLRCMQTLHFDLDRDFVELNQLLKLAGLCDSGGAGKQLVASGAVRVDGVVELRKTAKIRDGQRVRVGDVEIRVVAAP